MIDITKPVQTRCGYPVRNLKINPDTSVTFRLQGTIDPGYRKRKIYNTWSLCGAHGLMGPSRFDLVNVEPTP